MKQMKIEFTIGQIEKHKIEFFYSRLWGTKTIKADNQIVTKQLLPGLINLLAFMVAFLYLSYRLVFYDLTNFLELYLILIILGVIDIILALKSITVEVGERQKYSVQFKFVNKTFSSLRSAKFKVYVNGKNIFESLIGDIPKLKGLSSFSQEYQTWVRNTRVVIQNIFEKDSQYVEEFSNINKLLPFKTRIGKLRSTKTKYRSPSLFHEVLDSVEALIRSMIDKVIIYRKED